MKEVSSYIHAVSCVLDFWGSKVYSFEFADLATHKIQVLEDLFEGIKIDGAAQIV
jgi:hypothetical protein